MLNNLTHLIIYWYEEHKLSPVAQRYSNFNVHMNFLELLLKCGFWLSRPGVGPESLHL